MYISAMVTAKRMIVICSRQLFPSSSFFSSALLARPSAAIVLIRATKSGEMLSRETRWIGRASFPPFGYWSTASEVGVLGGDKKPAPSAHTTNEIAKTISQIHALGMSGRAKSTPIPHIIEAKSAPEGKSGIQKRKFNSNAF